MIPLGATLDPYGKCTAVRDIKSEKYYYFETEHSIAMLPASVVEPMYEGSKK